jgi:hypothetical protein
MPIKLTSKLDASSDGLTPLLDQIIEQQGEILYVVAIVEPISITEHVDGSAPVVKLGITAIEAVRGTAQMTVTELLASRRAQRTGDNPLELMFIDPATGEVITTTDTDADGTDL